MDRVTRSEAIAIYTWGPDTVVYNEATGHTHLLDPVAGYVMRLLVDTPEGMDIEALVEAIERADNVGDGPPLLRDIVRDDIPLDAPDDGTREVRSSGPDPTASRKSRVDSVVRVLEEFDRLHLVAPLSR